MRLPRGGATSAWALELQRTAGNRALAALVLSGSQAGELSVQRQLSELVLEPSQPDDIQRLVAALNNRIARYNTDPSREGLLDVLRVLKQAREKLGSPDLFQALVDEAWEEAKRFQQKPPEGEHGQSPPGLIGESGTETEGLLGSGEGKAPPDQPRTEEGPRAHKPRGGQVVSIFDQCLAWKEAGLVASPGDQQFFDTLFQSSDIMNHPGPGLDRAIYHLYSGPGPGAVVVSAEQALPICLGFWGALHGKGFFLQYAGGAVDSLNPFQMDPGELQSLGSDFCYRTVNPTLASSVRVYANIDPKPKVIDQLAAALIKRTDVVRDFKLAGPLSGGRLDGLVVWCPSQQAAGEVNNVINWVHSWAGGTLGASRPAMTGQLGGSGGIGTGTEPLSQGLATGQRSQPIPGYSDEAHSFGSIRSEVLAQAVKLFQGNYIRLTEILGMSPHQLFSLIAAGLFEEAGISGGAEGKPFDRKD